MEGKGGVEGMMAVEEAEEEVIRVGVVGVGLVVVGVGRRGLFCEVLRMTAACFCAASTMSSGEGLLKSKGASKVAAGEACTG